ncbi:MAG: FliM/FliN family flagellar motor switch protein [Actinomycetota bacterium]
MADSTPVADNNPFQQARLLTNDRAQMVSRTGEKLAEVFQDELSRWLSDPKVVPGAPEQTTLVDMVTPNTDLVVVKSLYQTTYGLITIDQQLALGMVAVLCGGLAQPAPDTRPLSRLETGVIDLLLQPLLAISIELFELEPAELGAHFATASALPHHQPDPVIMVPLTVTVSGIEGTVTVGLTATMLQRYSEEMDRRIAGQIAAKRDEPNVQIVRAVQPVTVELIAGFEPLQVPARQLVGLQVGDVLRTRQSITRPLVARVGGERLFQIRAAQEGQRLVAELTGVIESPGAALGRGDGND